MGAVSIDVYKKEKEYRQLTLSDAKVVRLLITERSKLDISYGVNAAIDINVAGEVTDFNVELIALYASLDHVLARIKMREREATILRLFFEGNLAVDIVEFHKYPSRTVYRTLNKIIDKVLEQNRKDWARVATKN